MSSSLAELSIDRFPFFVGARPPTGLEGLPAFLPLELTIDDRFAIARLKVTGEIRSALTQAYGIGSMLSTPIGHGSPPARARLMEALEGLLELAKGDVSGLRMLEVGCGTGELMAELQERGAQMTGCEIGPQGQQATERFGIPVIDTELSADSFDQPFDAIYSYGCLEHIIELDSFLKTCRGLLKDGGLFFHSVPNFELCMTSKRTEDLCHQHVNYFTPSSGPRLLAAQGFRDVGARLTRSGNELQLFGRYDSSLAISWPGEDQAGLQSERESLTTFAHEYQAHLNLFDTGLRERLDLGESLGFYAGGFSLVTLLGLEGDVRFYDGDPTKAGQCWLAEQAPIRSPASLIDDPVDHLVLCAEHHFDAVHRLLFDELGIPDTVQLHRLSDFAREENAV